MQPCCGRHAPEVLLQSRPLPEGSLSVASMLRTIADLCLRKSAVPSADGSRLKKTYLPRNRRMHEKRP